MIINQDPWIMYTREEMLVQEKKLISSICFFIGYCRESYRWSKEYYMRYNISKQIYDFETILISMNVMHEKNRTDLTKLK